jgi:RNA polymerase sigma factor (sigma-70 family)
VVESKHLILVKSVAASIKKRHRLGLVCDITDLESVGVYALHEASQRYRPECGKFELFARLIIWRAMESYLTTARRRREATLTTLRMLRSEESPEQRVIRLEFLGQLEFAFKRLPGRLRWVVTELCINGLKQSEVKAKCGLSAASVSHLYRVALHKMSDEIERLRKPRLERRWLS